MSSINFKGNIKDVYQKLVLKLEERSRLGGIMGIMHWDQEVIMPKGSADARAKQIEDSLSK